MKLIVSNNISLYENKQRFFKSNNINQIGIILKNPIQESQIEKITYNNILLNYSLSFSQYIIIVNTTDKTIFDFNKSGNYIFQIYEVNNEIPLNYVVEIIENNNNQNLIINHYIYKLTIQRKSL